MVSAFSAVIAAVFLSSTTRAAFSISPTKPDWNLTGTSINLLAEENTLRKNPDKWVDGEF